MHFKTTLKTSAKINYRQKIFNDEHVVNKQTACGIHKERRIDTKITRGVFKCIKLSVLNVKCT